MTTTRIRVDGSDQVGEARRAASAMAARLGFDETDAARAALVTTECATNVWKHGRGGELLLSPSGSEEDPTLEILALDRGPGLQNVALAFRDGYSTSGSPGTGLGAIERLSSFCDVYTTPGKGTALAVRIRKRAPIPSVRKQPVEFGAVSVPKPGEDVSGDDFAVRQFPGFCLIVVLDGLGHGPSAAQSATAGTTAFAEIGSCEPVDVIAALDRALRGTRGAAAAVACLDYRNREVRYAGIGNIAGMIVAEGSRHMVSYAGIVGSDVRKVREFTYNWPPGGMVLLYSDGISTHQSPAAYEGLLSRDTLLVAGVLYRDWNRGSDDATVLVARESVT